MPTSLSQTTENVPEAVAPVANLMASFPAPWAICGGWAVDAWLGRTTRDHGDVDFLVFDQQALFAHLPGWQLLAHDPSWTPGDNDEWWDGRRGLGHPSHIHARPPELSGSMPENGVATAEDGFNLDIQLNERDGDEWVMCREPRVSMSIRDAIQTSPWGVPTVVPEVLLFYKGCPQDDLGFLRRRDKLDFLALLPHLTREQREWLREAISLVGHPWLAQLSEEDEPAPA